uniref:Plant heme peroxidase family profile domain-containing protein n=1 Tax=Oryza meridionalis TaxID=40149 RepID=A0A0E0CG05_9ORYZ
MAKFANYPNPIAHAYPQSIYGYSGYGAEHSDTVQPIHLTIYTNITTMDQGAHTIGIAHCSSFADRLYGGAGAGGNANGKCRTAGDGVPYLTFDLGYYRAVLRHRGLLRSDPALATDAAARADIAGVVASPPEVFFQVFGRSMATLGAVQVKIGSQGEIRRNCAVVNSGH